MKSIKLNELSPKVKVKGIRRSKTKPDPFEEAKAVQQKWGSHP